MTIEELVKNTDKLDYQALCSALIKKFGVTRPVTWESVLPHPQQQGLFGGEVLRLIADHPTLATQKEIRPICLFPGDISQLLFFFVQLKDEKLPKSAIERITRKFIGGAAADRYIIWFFGNSAATNLKVVISGKEGKKIRLKTLELVAGHWFKTYDLILNEVERKFNTGGLFQSLKEPSGLWKAVWEAFDISIVNKKFYAEIKEIFDLLVKEELPKSKGVLLHEDERVQFAIRLIGRVIFCWFLKRKGIIAADVLSAKAVKSNSNYYHDILERLFFDVFNTPRDERKGDLPASIRNYPFLNGGLFEPQHEDHKGSWALNIGNDWFIRFFGNTLERYNFTVDENSAASSEIAIDPEMLGRIFENLLAEQNPDTGESARKSTGSFYTPREIVDFMVEESLIAYLKTNLLQNPPESPFSKGGASISPTLAKGGEGGFDGPIEDFVRTGILPDALKPYTKDLLRLLDAIKVLDPASGSGAFPISMLQKIVGLKHLLDTGASLYELKLRTIENSIYGVDIQPMATELSRLRCWLSLIVDEDPKKDIRPLPNLDFKFITANSLIDLGYDEFIHKVETGKIPGMFLTGFIKKMDELRDVRKRYFEATESHGEKERLKKEFKTIQGDLLKTSLELIRQKLLDAEFTTKITGWDPFDDSKPAPFFNKSWMFGVEDGFDVVIANPPYISHVNYPQKDKEVLSKLFITFKGRADLYVAFYERGIELLKNKGSLIYISPNKFFRAGYGTALRQYLNDKTKIISIVDFGDSPIFDATTYPCIIQLEKSQSAKYTFTYLKTDNVSFDDLNSQQQYEKDYLSNDIWSFEDSDLASIWKKIQTNSVDLEKYINKQFYRGIVTGLNEVFVIDENQKNNLISSNARISEIIKPYLKGKDVKRWYSKSNAYILYTYHGIDIKKYPEVLDYLRPFKNALEKRATTGKHEWYELQQPQTGIYHQFEKTKLISTDIAKRCEFTIDDSKSYIDNTLFCIPLKDLYLLSILNSSLIEAYYKSISSMIRGDFLRFKKIYLYKIPIKRIPIEKQQPFITLVDQILAAKQKDPQAGTSAFEKQIDEMVYKLYDLTPDEIAVVEGRS